jgi:uncharacterized protein (TIGR00369 family)
MIWQEPARGVFFPKAFMALPGIEILRAAQQGRLGRSPLAHLYGITFSMISPGAVSYMMPITPWLRGYAGTVPLPVVLAEKTMRDAVLSALPGRFVPRTVALSLSHTRSIWLDQGHLLARARAVHVGRRIAVAEVAIEDDAGRLVTHATAQCAIDSVGADADAPPLPLDPVEEPQYALPDPPLRVLTEVPWEPEEWEARGGLEMIQAVMASESRLAMAAYLGLHIEEVDAGRATVTMPITDWLRDGLGVVTPGHIALIATGAIGLAAWTLRTVEYDLRFPEWHFDFIQPVAPDAGQVISRAEVAHADEELLAITARVEQRDHALVAMASCQARLYKRQGGDPRPSLPGTRRLTKTVLFTDVVDSTALATQLGDTAWRALMARHDEAVRTTLRRHQGQMVKSTGDGVLATFDSASSAIACAIALQKTLEPDGIHLRAGLHTGEVEVRPNDIAGLAVNVCSRIVDLASGGEVLASSTVRDLLAGSELRFDDRGPHTLKGVNGDWRLFAVVA